VTAAAFPADTRDVGRLRFIALIALALSGAGCTLVLETVPRRADVVLSVDGTTSDTMRVDASVDADSAGSVGLSDSADDASDVPAIDTIGDDVTDASITRDAHADAFDVPDAIDARDVTIASDASDARLDVATDGRFDTGFFDVPSDRPFDSGLSDVPPDRAFDTGLSDAAIDRAFDVGSAVDTLVSDSRPVPDAPATDTGSIRCASDGECFAQYCGCTACTIDQVVCGTTATMSSCALGCPGAPPCPYIANVTCGCIAGSCAVTSRGGSGGAGTPCTASTDCLSGLLCCYPCGVAGCETVCTDVGPAGTCPMPP
jgi:hypothetical protein